MKFLRSTHLCKGNKVAIYQFIENNHLEFGLRWLFRKLNVHPNGYYNYLKRRKQAYLRKKAEVQRKMVSIYHERQGIPGYRMMQKLLIPHGFVLSQVTIHKYMKELGLKSIVRRKKPGYRKGPVHKVFPNLLNQDFRAEGLNQIWCVDFTYLYLKGRKVRYNCSIIDLYDRSIVATVNGDHITTELALRALLIAIKRYKPARGLIFHSDQGSQFTSKEFVRFCEAHYIQQSMSRAGCPYDNAPIERYFNTLKCELIYLFEYETERELDTAVAEFAYGWYNRIRPHTYNQGLTPAAARVA